PAGDEALVRAFDHVGVVVEKHEGKGRLDLRQEEVGDVMVAPAPDQRDAPPPAPAEPPPDDSQGLEGAVPRGAGKIREVDPLDGLLIEERLPLVAVVKVKNGNALVHLYRAPFPRPRCLWPLPVI